MGNLLIGIGLGVLLGPLVIKTFKILLKKLSKEVDEI